MRGVLLVLGTVVLLPYVVLALGFVLLGQAIASGSLAAFFMTLLYQALWLIPWGFIGLSGFMVLVAALGMSARFRWLGALCLSLIATGCVAVILVGSADHIGAPQLLFLMPCAVILVFAAWVAVVELRSLRLRGDHFPSDARSST